jgi:hypothetical protein
MGCVAAPARHSANVITASENSSTTQHRTLLAQGSDSIGELIYDAWWRLKNRIYSPPL